MRLEELTKEAVKRIESSFKGLVFEVIKGYGGQ